MRYRGDEAQRVKPQDERAAAETIAKLRSGEIDMRDVMVEAPAPGTLTALVVNGKPARR